MRIYLDSCMVIYLVERHPHHAAMIQQTITFRGTAEICVSPLVSLEVLVRPLRDRNEALAGRFRRYLAYQCMLPMPDQLYERALHLRVDHKLKTPDALHLATALHHDCDEFWTNDDRLTAVAPQRVVNILRPPTAP